MCCKYNVDDVLSISHSRYVRLTVRGRDADRVSVFCYHASGRRPRIKRLVPVRPSDTAIRETCIFQYFPSAFSSLFSYSGWSQIVRSSGPLH